MDAENRSDRTETAASTGDRAIGLAQERSRSTVFHETIRTDQDLGAYNRSNRFFDVTPTSGLAIDIDVRGLRSSTFSIWRLASQSGFRAVRRTPGDVDAVAVGMTTRGRLQCRDRAHEHAVEPGFGLFISTHDIRDVHASAGFDSLTCLFRRNALADHLRALAGEASTPTLDFEAVADLGTLALRSFQRNILATFERLTRAAGAEEAVDPLVEEILLYQLIGSWPQMPARQGFISHASSRHVQRSLDFIEANLTRQISVAEVAAAAGIGIRALQSSFRRDLGRTPVQHIIDRRLEQAHEDLRRYGHSAISTIALRWGFIHMSDFSRRYRQRFGCTPSETQIRAGRSG